MRAKDLLAQTEHRPLPLPGRPYWGHQVWEHLLFAHWPLLADRVAALLPAGLELDTWPPEPDLAWLGVVPFQMSGVRPRGLPAVPGISRFLELNVRTYVRRRGQPGVFFFSLDAGSKVGTFIARQIYRLPYHRAQMHMHHAADGVCFTSRRQSGPASASFAAAYAAVAPPVTAPAASLDHWLTGRYRVFSASPDGALWAADIHHLPWSLQPARATFSDLGVTGACGLPLGGEPRLLHFVRRLQVLVWGPQRLA